MATLYVITAYDFNHTQLSKPLHPLLFAEELNSVFYFVDEAGAPPGFSHPHLEERAINPKISRPGRLWLAEWSFLLSELEHCFAAYPFYMVSSRFHDKNQRLVGGLPQIWGSALSGLQTYGWGYLPSYDRDANFQDLREYFEKGRLGMRPEGVAYVDGLWGVRMVDEYRFISDFFCNYIGFQSRWHLERYVEFYLKFIRRFFNEDWQTIRDPELYVRRRDVFRAEKPFTLLLEMVSHLFFYCNDIKFSAISYDGSYEVDERRTRLVRLQAEPAQLP